MLNPRRNVQWQCDSIRLYTLYLSLAGSKFALQCQRISCLPLRIRFYKEETQTSSPHTLLCCVAYIAFSTPLREQRHSNCLACPSVLAVMRKLSRVRASEKRVRDHCRPTAVWCEFFCMLFTDFRNATFFQRPCSAEVADTTPRR